MKQQYVARTPESVPDNVFHGKPVSLNPKLRSAHRIPLEDPSDQIPQITTDEILAELQTKYPGVFNLSAKYEHRLLQKLAKKIFDRVNAIVMNATDEVDTCFKLSRTYRRTHPHFGDFQLILSTLHAIQDADGVPRLQLEEADLIAPPNAPHMLDMPLDKARQLCNKYQSKVAAKISEHVKSLDTEMAGAVTEEDLARKQIRQELQKLEPFLTNIVNEVVLKSFKPNDGPHYTMRIYGEPFLPGKEVMAPFLSRFQPVHLKRSMRMFNLLQFNVTPPHYQGLITLNGTVLNGATLTIRSVHISHYKLSNALAKEKYGEEDMELETLDEDEDQDDME